MDQDLDLLDVFCGKRAISKEWSQGLEAVLLQLSCHQRSATVSTTKYSIRLSTTNRTCMNFQDRLGGPKRDHTKGWCDPFCVLSACVGLNPAGAFRYSLESCAQCPGSCLQCVGGSMHACVVLGFTGSRSSYTPPNNWLREYFDICERGNANNILMTWLPQRPW